MGRSRGGLTSKIHTVMDADGRPVALRLPSGQVHNACEAEALTEAMPVGATSLGDKGYGSNASREMAAERKCWANIPNHSDRKECFASPHGFTGSGPRRAILQ
jgi:transposase